MTTKRNPYFSRRIMCSQKTLLWQENSRKWLPVPGKCWVIRRCDILSKTILTGKIKGKRGPDRRQHSWLRDIRNWCNVPDAATSLSVQKRARFALCGKHMYAYALHRAYGIIKRRRQIDSGADSRETWAIAWSQSEDPSSISNKTPPLRLPQSNMLGLSLPTCKSYWIE